MMNFTQAEVDVIQGVLTVGVTTVVGFVSKFLYEKIGVSKIQKIQKFAETHHQLAKMAVLFAEQAYSDLGGSGKKAQAMSFLTKMLNQHNIPIPADQMDSLLESALGSLKAELGDSWNSISKSGSDVMAESNVPHPQV